MEAYTIALCYKLHNDDTYIIFPIYYVIILLLTELKLSKYERVFQSIKKLSAIVYNSLKYKYVVQSIGNYSDFRPTFIKKYKLF